MDISTPPSLDLTCPQAKTEIEKHVHMLRDKGLKQNTDIEALWILL